MRSRSNFAKNYGVVVGGGALSSRFCFIPVIYATEHRVCDIFQASPDRVRQDLKYLSGLFYGTFAWGRIKFGEVLLCRRMYDSSGRAV